MKDIIRVKMGDQRWCDEYKVMCEKDYQWKNIVITCNDEDIDYYVIINIPEKGWFFIPKKTIIFQMEPEFSVKRWKEWAAPCPNKFLYVGSHENYLNLAQIQFKKIPSIFPKKRYNKLMIILSHKLNNPGHIKRVNFLKKDNDLIDIYGRKNYHNLKNYKGVLPNNNKENLFVKYKYSFHAENNMEYNYATEKIWESIVCENLCFYWGCPNLEEYIDSGAFVRLDLDNIEESYRIIKQAIKEDWWSQRINSIKKMKKKILNELAFFPVIEKIIKEDNTKKK